MKIRAQCLTQLNHNGDLHYLFALLVLTARRQNQFLKKVCHLKSTYKLPVIIINHNSCYITIASVLYVISCDFHLINKTWLILLINHLNTLFLDLSIT